MKTIGVAEAKTRFSELLAEVVADGTIEITKNGTPVARLVPVRDVFADAAAASEEWERYRDEHNIALGGDLTVRKFIRDFE